MRVINIVDDDDDEETFPYVALSYRWSEDASEELLLDGKGIIRISKDLDAALRRFRYASALRWIWVDGICINQQDNTEKSMQIPLMANIYRGASRVMIWLGNRAEDADLLRRIKSLVREAKCSKVFDPSLPSQVTKATRTLVASLSLNMSQLGRLEWFTRRWVLQELTLNANAILCCGQTELPWPQLTGVLGRNGVHDEHQVRYGRKLSLRDPNQREPGLRRIQLLWDLWWNTTISPRPRSKLFAWRLEDHEIPALMDSCSDFECTNGHDRIAALLGLSRDAQGPTAFRVDYADSVEKTYVKFAETLVRTGHLAWLLCQRFERENNRNNRATILPSWVPDWRLKVVEPPLTAHAGYQYSKGPAYGIQASNDAHGVSLLTTNFWSFTAGFWTFPWVSVSHEAPAVSTPPFLEISWKNRLFPEGTGLEERVALVLVDLWPRIVARLSEDARSSRRKMWYSLLSRVVHLLSRSRRGKTLVPGLYGDDDYPKFGEEDVNDLEELRRYIISRVRNTKAGQDRRNSEGLLECLVFCQEASDYLCTSSVCGMASVPASFYKQVEVGDKVLLANLGHFFTIDLHAEVELQWSIYIVREQQRVEPKGFIDSATDGLGSEEQSSSHGTRSCYDPNLVSELVSPGVYEFVAPCQVFSSSPWTHRSFVDDRFFNGYDSRGVKDSDEVRSIWIR